MQKNTKNPEVLGTLRGIDAGDFDGGRVSGFVFVFFVLHAVGRQLCEPGGIWAGDDAGVDGAGDDARRCGEDGGRVFEWGVGEGQGTIVFESPVRAISQTDAGVVVESDKGKWEADYAIVCLPPPLALRIRYAPILPPEREILLQHMPMGSVIKYWVAYEKPFWRGRGIQRVDYER